MTLRRVSRSYADPYVAGVALGLVLLAAFMIAGRGLGASGAFAKVASATVAFADSATAAQSAYFGSYNSEGPVSRDWLVVEIIGVMIGGALSAALAGRWRLGTERGPRVSDASRLTIAVAGGAIMGAGAVIARGCTSGQALTGGAMLSVGSWCFMLAAFAGGYGAAPVLRRWWT